MMAEPSAQPNCQGNMEDIDDLHLIDEILAEMEQDAMDAMNSNSEATQGFDAGEPSLSTLEYEEAASLMREGLLCADGDPPVEQGNEAAKITAGLLETGPQQKCQEGADFEQSCDQGSSSVNSSVREILQTAVKLRIEQEGKVFVEMEPHEMVPTEEERQKEATRKERNRLSAHRSREKKKTEKAELQRSIEENKEKRLYLHISYEAEKTILKKKFDDLKDLCPKTPHGKGLSCPKTQGFLKAARRFQEECGDEFLDFASSHSQAANHPGGHQPTYALDPPQSQSPLVLANPGTSVKPNFDPSYVKSLATSASCFGDNGFNVMVTSASAFDFTSSPPCVTIGQNNARPADVGKLDHNNANIAAEKYYANNRANSNMCSSQLLPALEKAEKLCALQSSIEFNKDFVNLSAHAFNGPNVAEKCPPLLLNAYNADAFSAFQPSDAAAVGDKVETGRKSFPQSANGGNEIQVHEFPQVRAADQNFTNSMLRLAKPSDEVEYSRTQMEATGSNNSYSVWDVAHHENADELEMQNLTKWLSNLESKPDQEACQPPAKKKPRL